MDMNLNAWGDELGLKGMGDNTSVLNEHDEPVQDVVEPLPEMHEEIEASDAVSAGIEDATALLASIIEAGGMNQAFALEAERLMPGFLDGAPIGYYSKITSATRYSVAVEEITLGIGALIAAGIAALALILKKIYDWFFGDDAGDAKHAAREIEEAAKEEVKEQAKVDDVIKEVVQEVKEVEQTIAKGITVTDEDTGKEVEIHRTSDIIEDIVKTGKSRVFNNFYKKMNGFQHDYLKGEELWKHIDTVGLNLETMQLLLKKRIENLSKAAADFLQKSHNTNKNANEDDEVLSLVHRYAGFTINDNNVMKDARAYIDETIALFYEVKNKEVPSPYKDFKTLFDDYYQRSKHRSTSYHYINDRLVQYTKMLVEANDSLNELDSQLGNPASDDQVGSFVSVDGQFFRQVRDNLRDCYLYIAKALSFVQSYLSEIARLSDSMLKLLRAFNEELERRLRMGGMKPDELPACIKAMRELGREGADAVQLRNIAIRKRQRSAKK